MSEEKKLRRLNLLNKTIKITKQNIEITGLVFFFSLKALIVQCSETHF